MSLGHTGLPFGGGFLGVAALLVVSLTLVIATVIAVGLWLVEPRDGGLA